MANDMNVVVLIGRITRDAELKHTTSGTAVCRFSLAVNRRVGKDKDEEVSYIDISIWGKGAEALEKYLTKGRQVCVQGELRQSRWEQDGQARSRIEVIAETVQLIGSDKTDKDQNLAAKASKTAQDRRQAEKRTTTTSEKSEPIRDLPADDQSNPPLPQIVGPEDFDDDIPF
jgi:single-strand DNA-binding protein